MNPTYPALLSLTERNQPRPTQSGFCSRLDPSLEQVYSGFMDDWSKTLLSTSAGFIAGLAAEPIKLWIGANSARRALKKALYDELGKSCGKMASVVQYATAQDDDPSLLWGLRTLGMSPITVDVFDHYYDKHRDLVYSLSEAQWLVHIYKVIMELNQIPDEPPRQKISDIEKALRHVYVVIIDSDLPSPGLRILAREWLKGKPTSSGLEKWDQVQGSWGTRTKACPGLFC